MDIEEHAEEEGTVCDMAGQGCLYLLKLMHLNERDRKIFRRLR